MREMTPLQRLQYAVDAIYSQSQLYWNMGIGIVDKPPRKILSEEDMIFIKKAIDKETPIQIGKFNGIDYCPECRHQVTNLNYNYCPHCGHAIEE